MSPLNFFHDRSTHPPSWDGGDGDEKWSVPLSSALTFGRRPALDWDSSATPREDVFDPALPEVRPSTSSAYCCRISR